MNRVISWIWLHFEKYVYCTVLIRSDSGSNSRWPLPITTWDRGHRKRWFSRLKINSNRVLVNGLFDCLLWFNCRVPRRGPSVTIRTSVFVRHSLMNFVSENPCPVNVYTRSASQPVRSKSYAVVRSSILQLPSQYRTTLALWPNAHNFNCYPKSCPSTDRRRTRRILRCLASRSLALCRHRISAFRPWGGRRSITTRRHCLRARSSSSSRCTA